MRHSNNEITQLAQKLSGRRIMVIGDVMLDRYLSGEVNRISPEAPVPILNHKQTYECPGGAANVALNLRSMNNEVFITSMVGDDEEGRALTDLLTKHGIHTSSILSIQNRTTTTKIRVMAGSQHLLRVDREVVDDLSEESLNQLLGQTESILRMQRVEMIIFQDYNKGMLTERSISAFLDLARKFNIPTAVDPKFSNFMSYREVTIFKPNLLELRNSVPFPVPVIERDLQKAATYLREKLACHTVLITLSDQGIYVNQPKNSALVPVVKRTIADVCGAGDTVISIAALAWLAELPARDLAYWASFAGTVTCQYPGVVPVSPEMLQRDSSDNQDQPAHL